MGDRPKWMPSNEAIDKAWSADFIVPIRSGKPNISAVVLNAGLRAQIAALEEEDAHMVAYLGEYNDENREWRQSKLAKLRKELEG